MSTPVTVTNHPEISRYEARVDDELAGFLEYELSAGLITFTHTRVQPAYEGRGIGSALVRTALDEVTADGTRQVLPRCPFVKRWIDLHPDYQRLLREPSPAAD
jgi:predicted GNAT family acetyltransferase